MADEALKVEDRAEAFECVKRPPGQLLVADPDQSAPFGAEQRLDHDVASQRIESRQCFGRPLPGPGRRHRQGRRLEQGQRQILVDRRFDGPRRVEDRHARGRDPVQGVHPEDDLLETPGGIIRTSTPSAAVRSSSPAVTRGASRLASDDRRDPRKRHRVQRHTQPAGRAQQVFDMPAEAGNQGDQRRH